MKIKNIYKEVPTLPVLLKSNENNPPLTPDNPPTSPFTKGGTEGIFKRGKGDFQMKQNLIPVRLPL